MTKILQGVKQFLNDEEGVTAIEYGLLAALVALGIVGGATVLGGSLSAAFTNIGARLTAAIPAA